MPPLPSLSLLLFLNPGVYTDTLFSFDGKRDLIRWVGEFPDWGGSSSLIAAVPAERLLDRLIYILIQVEGR